METDNTLPRPYKDHPYKDHFFKHESGPYRDGECILILTRQKMDSPKKQLTSVWPCCQKP